MTVARDHARWLSLLDVSGPFLSLSVLCRAFPQGLDGDRGQERRDLRDAYEEWLDGRGNADLHRAWVRYVLTSYLGHPAEPRGAQAGAAAGADLPQLTIPEQGVVLRPDRVLRDPGSGAPRLLVTMYGPGQDLEREVAGERYKASPASRMLDLLRGSGVRLGLVTNGERWMLVDAPAGGTASFVSWYSEIWFEELITLRAFDSLLNVRRFFGVTERATLEGLLAESAQYQSEVTDKLGYQVRRAVEVLVQSLDRADQDSQGTLLAGLQPSEIYEAALTVMMRLVFLFTAEERGLLLLGDPVYDANYAVSTLGAQLREAADTLTEEVLERRYDAWVRLLATFRAVYGGVLHEDLRIAAYEGRLFDPEIYPFLEGRRPGEPLGAREPLPINNRVVLHLLEALQYLRIAVREGEPPEARRLSFRALDVEQIGHVYEGLLDHEARRAGETVLGLTGAKGQEPEVPLSGLLARAGQGEDALIGYLVEETGRSESALRNALRMSTEDGGEGKKRRKAVARRVDDAALRIACGHDEDLFAQVKAFSGLIRLDDFGHPTVIRAGSLHVTAGAATRRSSGTHYTPRELTEPVVAHTLEPLLYAGMKEGRPREAWVLKPAAEILALKICDPAMGSGGFLVQVVRYLSARLLEAWETAGVTAHGPSADGRYLQVTPEGSPATGALDEVLIPTDPAERLIFAQRLVAERCLYGVDKNPLAVEMAKLSLWLITLAKDRPFSFVDHSLRAGDALLGASEDLVLRWAQASGPVFADQLKALLAEAREKRVRLESFEVRTPRDVVRKRELLAEADQALARLRLAGDLLIGLRLIEPKASERPGLESRLFAEYMPEGGETRTRGDTSASPLWKAALAAGEAARAFHWEFEFPEVFAAGGFSAFVGNPPFIGGTMLTGLFGETYRESLLALLASGRGNADYCAYFFLQAFGRLRQGGALGLVATNTISQGDTREVGLDRIVAQEGVIFRAEPNRPWPGKAAVFVSVVHIGKDTIAGPYWIDSHAVSLVTSQLTAAEERFEKPWPLQENQGIAFAGTKVYGQGFVLEPSEAQGLIQIDGRNAEVLFPYMNGEDLNSRPDQSPSRWVINFFDWPLERAEQYGEPMRIVREKVKPERDQNNRAQYRKRWWQYGERRPGLQAAIAGLSQVLVAPVVTKYLSFVLVPNNQVFAHRLVVLAIDDPARFSVLQADVYDHWARSFSSTLKMDLNFSPSDCFTNFPFPAHAAVSGLAAVGKQYHEHRAELTLSRQEGLTNIYNHLHDRSDRSSDIEKFRELHVELNQAVIAAYGWSDLTPSFDFYPLGKETRFRWSDTVNKAVMSRLLSLNADRHRKESEDGPPSQVDDGRRRRSPSRKKASNKRTSGQPSLI
jgi:hypothetical protein